eukprot:gnl/MRDRNA2_/MRDRNA2_100850_c0_seq1.p1 gnl/MRDRNA2_/MRDRNA2_100850_c0~~gnl/MRDRNA2_/MRDRNA2_100850_c0_seq1.p1  ORF type:complete len:419 (+),score=106.09 gnl/MRDRNA2_/MRDRNA2_100850_c0_seq1:81-1337(+)
MGCGASAVKEQPVQSGPVGSAASLAKWKRTQQTQPKLVECSLPTSIEQPKANDKEALLEVETNCGSSTDEAYSETQSRPVSRESMVSDSASLLSDHEMKCRQLRLQMSKACALAAKSGDLMTALQQVRAKPQPSTKCTIAPPTAPASSRRFSRKKTTPSKQEPGPGNADLDTIKAKAAVGLVGLLANPEAARGLFASRDSNQAPNQEAQKDIESLKKRISEHLQRCSEAGTLEHMLQESMECTSKAKDSEQLSKDTSNHLDIVRQKAAKILEQSVTSGTLQKVMTQELSERTKSDDYEHLRQRGASALMNALSSGSLESVLAASMSKKADDNGVTAIRQRAASSFVNAAQSGNLADALHTITVRENARKALEEAYSNGSLNEVVTSSLQEKKEVEGNDVEKIRQKAQASLQAFLASAA